MKKFLIRVAIAIAGLVGVSVANNVILLKIHPLEFYYTPTGLMITAIVTGVEMLILYPLLHGGSRKSPWITARALKKSPNKGSFFFLAVETAYIIESITIGGN